MGSNLTRSGVNNTAFSPNADKTAQLTGSGQLVPGSISPTYAATIALDSILQYSCFVSLTTIGSTAATVTTGTVFNAGGLLNVLVNQVSGGSATVTFSTGFKVNGTVSPNSAKAVGLSFVSDGTNFIEFSRTSIAGGI